MQSLRSNNLACRHVKDSLRTVFDRDSAREASIDAASLPWVNSELCMKCALGLPHNCNAPKYVRRKDKDLPCKRKMLHLHLNRPGADDLINTATYIVRYQPSFWTLPHHTHAQGEEYVVLRGSFNDDAITAPSLTWVLYPPGSDHYAQPEDCDVLCWRGQLSPEAYRPKPMAWWREGATTAQSMSLTFQSSARPGSRHQSPWEATTFGYILRLYEGEGGETTYAEHWFPDTECEEVIQDKWAGALRADRRMHGGRSHAIAMVIQAVRRCRSNSQATKRS